MQCIFSVCLTSVDARSFIYSSAEVLQQALDSGKPQFDLPLIYESDHLS